MDWYGCEWLNSAQDELRAVEQLERRLQERKSAVRKAPAADPIGVFLGAAGNLTRPGVNMSVVEAHRARGERILPFQDPQGSVQGTPDTPDTADFQGPATPDTPETPE